MHSNHDQRVPLTQTGVSLAALDLVIEASGWRRIPNLHFQLQKAANATLALLPLKFRHPFCATVLLTENNRIRRLNRDFRGIDKPTNVLSFPQYPPSELPKNGKIKGPIELGDIALAYTYIKKESIQNNKILINHVSHLVIHGLLHLFGYDHGVDCEAEVMEKLETKIMHSLGLPSPYQPAPSRTKRNKTTRRKK